ncbi:MAG TPA: DUF29 domain-containing protein [Cyanothece sp. UBA12306]|nr:DUF29 domain-containing protein [Cyanothece sp. UBA12306]
MVSELQQYSTNLYDTDYNLWLKETVKKLQKKDFETIDLENLIEEVLDLSRRQKKKLKNLLIKLFEHLLKLAYWQVEKEYNQGHWQGEILTFRQQINDELQDSPSLKPYLSDIFGECYQKGKAIASKRSQLPPDTFPPSPIGNLEQILNEDWLP